MADLAAGFDIIARNAGQALSQLAGLVCQEWAPLPDAAPNGGIAFRAQQNDQPFIAYLEAFTRWDERALWRILESSSQLTARERTPTLCLLYMLFPAGYRPQGGQFRLRVGADPTQALWFREVCLWDLTPEPWWENFPGLMTLYPLAKHRFDAAQAVTLASERIRKYEKDLKVRADLHTILALLARIRYPDADVVGIIGKERMKESPLYDELLAEGGVAQCRDDIAQVVQLRFGDREARQCRKLLDGVAELDELRHLLREAVTSKRFEQFRRAFDEK